MTDHPKPIARYVARKLGIADHSIVDTETGIVFIVASRIHAERITDLLNGQDARIAELERVAKFYMDSAETSAKGRHKAELERDDLRTAIEAKAREFQSEARALRGSTMSGGSAMKAFEDCASELLALLEKKP